MTDFLLRTGCRITFAAHAVIAAAYLWVSPKGFAINHSRFWLNTPLPLCVVLVAVWGSWSIFKKRTESAASAVLLFSSGWLGGSIAGRVCFPESLRGFWALGLIVASCGFGLYWMMTRTHKRQRIAFLFAPACALAGVFSVWAQIPPAPATRPMDVQVPAVSTTALVQTPRAVQFGENHAQYYPRSSEMVVRFGDVRVHCFPRLRFDRVSPDGFWSLIAPPNRPDYRLVASESLPADRERFAYGDQTTVEVFREPSGETVECTAWSTLSAETYSHLNTFTVLVIEGHEELTIGFSPCPDARIEVMPSDYPVGRPARMAFLTETETFVVAEATSGEKGPFHQLASGQLKRGEPLTVSLYDGGKLVGAITLEDWTTQLSTDLSPSAGWGVPMNAIEFRRADESNDSSVELYITLAATSVGRGWETVGHRAGTYRNRMKFVPATDEVN